MTRKVIAIVDDDESVRESLPALLESFGMEAFPYSSAEEFLVSAKIDDIDCLILDVAMPGMSGPDLQRELVGRNYDLPVIFITAHSDNEALRGALKGGSVACLIKPFGEAALLEAVQKALGGTRAS
jgi:FixJ family two-component response regulator